MSNALSFVHISLEVKFVLSVMLCRWNNNFVHFASYLSSHIVTADFLVYIGLIVCLQSILKRTILLTYMKCINAADR